MFLWSDSPPMFLYTSMEISLYVVTIFNTSVNVQSFDFSSEFCTLRLWTFSFSIFRMPLSMIGKGLFFTGTFIYRTTDILNCNWNHAVHGTLASLSLILNIWENIFTHIFSSVILLWNWFFSSFLDWLYNSTPPSYCQVIFYYSSLLFYNYIIWIDFSVNFWMQK